MVMGYNQGKYQPCATLLSEVSVRVQRVLVTDKAVSLPFSTPSRKKAEVLVLDTKKKQCDY